MLEESTTLLFTATYHSDRFVAGGEEATGREGAVIEVIIIIAGTIIVIMQHIPVMVTTGPGLTGDSEAI